MHYDTQRTLNVFIYIHDSAKEVLQRVNQHGVSNCERIKSRRERERAHRAAETAAEKKERLQKRDQGLRNREWQGGRENVLRRAKDFQPKLKNSERSG